jgi:hypothetical protein
MNKNKRIRSTLGVVVFDGGLRAPRIWHWVHLGDSGCMVDGQDVDLGLICG